MQHRIRSAALVVEGDSLLLLRHRHPRTWKEWWVPPGGGVKGAESVFHCAQRETLEETGLTVALGEIAYVREYIEMETPTHHLEFFIMAQSHTGAVTIANLVKGDPDAEVIREARFVPRAEIGRLTVYPEILKDRFWDDLKRGFSVAAYLGVQWQSADEFTPA